MTAHFDTIIVGGGLLGMLSARELALAGQSVALFDQGRTGRESTWAGGGILSPLYPWRYAEAVTALAGWGQQRYADFARQLEQESGIDPEYRHSGLLILDTDERAQALAWAQRWQQDLQLVGPEEISQIEPRLASISDQALWLPQIGQLRNPRLALAARGSIEALGVRIFENSPVEAILIDNQTVTGIRSGEETVEAGQVVIAGGAWSGGLLAQFGIKLPVRPVRGQMILFRAEPGLVSRIVLSQDRYVIPRRDGRVLVGSTMEEVGFDKSTTEEALAELQAEACRIIPALADYSIEHHWAGLRPGTPTGIPYIYGHPDLAGLFVNTGHFRNGVVLGLASARLLADLVLQRAPILDPDPYVYH